jgi:hypothetical protein
MINVCGVIGKMRIGMGSGSIRRKAGPMPIFPPQIPQDFTWDQPWIAVMERPQLCPGLCLYGPSRIVFLFSNFLPDDGSRASFRNLDF